MKSALFLSLAVLCARPAAQQDSPVRIPSPPPAAGDPDRKTETWTAPVKGMPQAAAHAEPVAGTEGLPPKPPVQSSATRLAGRAPAEGVFVDRSGDDRIWARGHTYKASFDGKGAAYIPFLGSDAPRNYPVRFELRSVRVGGQDVAFQGDGVAEHKDRRVTIARHAVTEVYDLAPDGVEQSFVFTTLPSGGDLVVRVDVASELRPSQVDGELRFGNELGQVGYGGAVVLDAAGHRAQATRTFDDGAIVLTVPASFLADATFPVTIDPRVSTFNVRGTALVESAADIAYDSGSGRYLVVWEEVFSSADHDIGSVLQDESGAAVPNSFAYIDPTGESWAHPRVASLPMALEFLTVAERGQAPARQIWGRTRSANTLVPAGTPFEVSANSGAGDKLNPDVGGDPSPVGPAYWTVVWERTYSATDSDIHARQVNADGTRRGSVILVENNGSEHDTHPAISKSNGGAPAASQDWIVVWQRTYSPTDEDLRFARIHWDGVLSTPSSDLSHTVNNETNPTVSSPTSAAAGRSWLVAYEETFAQVSSVMVALGHDGTRVTSARLSTLENRNTNRAQAGPHVDSDGCRFVVAYCELTGPQTADWDILATTCHVAYGTTLGVSEANAILAFDVTPELRPRITAARSGGGPVVRYACVWDETVAQSPLNIDIKGALHDGRAGYSGFIYSYTGCNGLSLSASGLGTVGASVDFQLTGIVPGNLPLMMFGLPFGPSTVCGNCGLGVSLGTVTFFTGATLSVPIPSEGAFVGGTVAAQGLTLGTGPCLGQVSLSDTVWCVIQ